MRAQRGFAARSVVDVCARAGSVSMDNCEPIAALPDVDGFLVGGAATRLVYAGHSAGVKVRNAKCISSQSDHPP